MSAHSLDLTRRTFLRTSGLTLAGFGASSLLPGPFVQHALASVPNKKKLLFIFQRGGNDGINSIIPHGDVDYNATRRPNIYIPPAESIDTGNGFAHFHPGLGALMDLYNAGELAAMHRIGYPNQSRSHFDGQRVWENGNPADTQLFEGWLYRFARDNALSSGASIPIVTSQAQPPMILRGDERYINVANPNAFDYLHPAPERDKYQTAWRRRYDELRGVEKYRPLLSKAGVDLIDTLDEYRAWDQANWHPTHPDTGLYLFPVDAATNPDDPSSADGKRFPANSYAFFRSLKLAALSLLEDGNGTRVAGTELNGWDTHQTQGGATGLHETLLDELAYGMQSLSVVLSGAATNEPRGYTSVWDDTVVVTLTEFGRTTEENGSDGTDHAQATTVFAAGGNVNGGVYNCDAGSWGTNNGVMFDIEGRYLSWTTDFRAVMWEILRDHMGADPATAAAIFPGFAAGQGELGIIV